MTLVRVRRAVLVSMVAVLLTAGHVNPAGALEFTPRVFPPNYPFGGKTYAQWSVDWWKWILEVPATNNPLLDTTGADCAVHQPGGRVWFLAGSPGGAVTRTCTVRYDKALFFPLVNIVALATGPADTEASIHADARAFVDGVDPSTLFARLDGRPIPNLGSYRAHSPTFFLNLPPDNLFGLPPGIWGPAAADGYYLLLLPLRPGWHTLHFGGEFPDGSPVDVTYRLNIVP
jgi:hypothetical protein